ncbi:MAG: ATP-grasp domain-containing protein [Candidatus Kerfeldbacteria bacterium]|nr:ATP-grasp domain-containing protein [Candidatus Kerfeldbacteria bacterium]
MKLTRESVERYRVRDLSMTGSLLCRAAKRLGMSITFLPDRFVKIKHGKKELFFRGSDLPCYDFVAGQLADDKYAVRGYAERHGIPVPRTIVLFNPSEWKRIQTSRLHFPLAVKPFNASHGNGATMNIRTWDEFQKAVKKAFEYLIKKKHSFPRVLVEEFIENRKDIRLLVIGEKVVSVIYREPAYVIGDGRSTIQQLIQRYNNEWDSSYEKYDLPLCPIPIDRELRRCVRSQNLQLSSIPKKGKKITLRWNSNVSTGGQTTDITDEVHPNIKKLAIKAAQLIQVTVAGVDLQCKEWTSPDISRKNCIILETNSSAGVGFHIFPAKGKGRDAALEILKFTFKIR